MTGPAMVRPASSDFWKVPYDFLVAWKQELAASGRHIQSARAQACFIA